MLLRRERLDGTAGDRAATMQLKWQPALSPDRAILLTIVLLSISVFAQSQEVRKIWMEPSKKMERVISRLRTAYAAFNRGDFDSAVAPLDPQIEWTEPAEFPG